MVVGYRKEQTIDRKRVGIVGSATGSGGEQRRLLSAFRAGGKARLLE
jgi:hypothetical protein